MLCPSCKQTSLHYTQFEDDLPCKHCSSCGGSWLLLSDYLPWQAKHETQEIAEATDFHIGEIQESKSALLCPVSGVLMLKFRISSKTDHRLDLSPAANGIWLDKGEWDLLKAEGLTGKLNHIFTAPWQKQIQTESAKEMFEALYAQRFGDEDYQKLKEFRKWLDSKDRVQMLAYLVAKDPYAATR